VRTQLLGFVEFSYDLLHLGLDLLHLGFPLSGLVLTLVFTRVVNHDHEVEHDALAGVQQALYVVDGLHTVRQNEAFVLEGLGLLLVRQSEVVAGKFTKVLFVQLLDLLDVHLVVFGF